MNHRIVLPALVLVFLLESCSGLFTTREKDDFIKVKGTQFIHNSKPYYYAGTNLWYGCYVGSPGPTGNRERLRRELDSLQAFGLVNLRVLAASEESYIKRSVKPAYSKGAGSRG